MQCFKTKTLHMDKFCDVHLTYRPYGETSLLSPSAFKNINLWKTEQSSEKFCLSGFILLKRPHKEQIRG